MKVLKLIENARELFNETFNVKKLLEPDFLIDPDFKSMQTIISGYKEAHSKWSPPDNYHLTQLYVGANTKSKESPIYRNFKEGVDVDVTVPALIYIPGSILIAICFPPVPVENDFPHITLMLCNKMKARMSNDVLK